MIQLAQKEFITERLESHCKNATLWWQEGGPDAQE